MKANIFRASSRGTAEHGWLHSRFFFSFANYYNPSRMDFGMLRVVNDDIIEPGEGFGMHPHNNMEIITIPISGKLEHKDSMGNGSVINSGDVQVMSAGTGIMHSEFNPSADNKVSLFQIWILPKDNNIVPKYDQKTFEFENRLNEFQLLVAPEGTKETLTIHQDAYISFGKLNSRNIVTYKCKRAGNGIFLMIISGSVEFEDTILNERDWVEIQAVDVFQIKSQKISELLVIDVPMK
jgi:quercetin 2,3-dioxygenase